jgi:hypothetical protein
MARKVALGCLGALLVFALAFVVWWNVAMRVPGIPIPTVKMPHPNALDYYGKATQDWSDADRALPRAALGLAHASPFWARPSSAPSLAHPHSVWSTSEMLALLGQYGRVLPKTREGFRYACRWPRPFASTYMELTMDGTAIPALFSLESQVRAAQGDWRGAAASCVDCLHFASDLTHGAPVEEMKRVYYAERMAIRSLRVTIPHLSAHEAGAVAEAVARLRARRAPLADVIAEQKWLCVDELTQYFSSRQPLRDWFDDRFSPTPYVGPQTRMLLRERSHIIQDVVHAMDRMIARAKLPWDSLTPFPPPSPVSDMIYGPLEYGGVAVEYQLADTRLALLIAELALRAYVAEHGSYPPTFPALSPRYLPSPPTDPFSHGQPLRYRPTGKSYVLYSLGPDELDYGGTPVSGLQPLDYVVRDSGLRPTDTGDILAGQ